MQWSNDAFTNRFDVGVGGKRLVYGLSIFFVYHRMSVLDQFILILSEPQAQLVLSFEAVIDTSNGVIGFLNGFLAHMKELVAQY